MNITVDLDLLLYNLAEGNLHTHGCVSIELALLIQSQASEVVHVEPYGDKGAILWTKFGWEQEQLRRKYIEEIRRPGFDKLYPSTPYISSNQVKSLERRETVKPQPKQNKVKSFIDMDMP